MAELTEDILSLGAILYVIRDAQLGVEFGSKLITIPEENKVVKLQCAFYASHFSVYSGLRFTLTTLHFCIPVTSNVDTALAHLCSFTSTSCAM